MNENNRILIIDDNKSIHEDFNKILQPHKISQSLEQMNSLLVGKRKLSLLPDFELDYALQGDEGVNMVHKALEQNKPYAVAFVDVQMPPGNDGVDAITKMWKIDLNIQTVICTAYSKYSWDDLQEKFGGSERLFVLKKPFDTIEVVQMAVALTRRWNINRLILKQLSMINTLPDDKKSGEPFRKLKESFENLSRLTSKMKDKD